MRSLLFSLGVTISLWTSSGCLMGDNAGGVRGSIVDTDGNEFDECVLQLYAGDDELVDERKVQRQFREIFSLTQAVSVYRVVVRCKGSTEEYAVDGIVLGTRESYLDAVDVGQIVLPRDG